LHIEGNGVDMVIETEETTVSVELSPPFAAGETYEWHVLIRDEFTTVSSQDTFAFSIEGGTSGIACNEISRYQARCRPGGIIQARIILTNTKHTGEPVVFTVDGLQYETTVSRQGRAVVSLSGYAVGSHEVELAVPAGCYDPVMVNCPAGLTADDDEDSWMDDEGPTGPHATVLLGNHPNPFNPTTTLKFVLSKDTHVTLTIHNMLGQVVATLVDENKPAGNHSVVWDGLNESGERVASGTYVYRLTAGEYVETRKLLLLK
jgi:hypothetical protein